MKTAGGDDHDGAGHEPKCRPSAEGPSGETLEARTRLLATFDIQFDGLAYLHRGQRFEHFTDALEHARRVWPDGVSTAGTVRNPPR